jgi:hypothetical protein
MPASVSRVAAAIFAVAFAWAVPSAAQAADASARALVGQAIAAQGGETGLRSAPAV